MTLTLGAILGFISVALGAYAEHGLKIHLSTDHFAFIMTAVRYNQLYAIIISVIGLTLLNDTKLSTSITFKLSGLLFIIGTLLFSFSIYISIIYDIPNLLKLTPIGGTALMLAWITLAITGLLILIRRKT